MPITYYSDTQAPVTVTTTNSVIGGVTWQNPNNIKVEDGVYSQLSYLNVGDYGATIKGSGFAFRAIPDNAVIAGLEVRTRGYVENGANGEITINLPGSETKYVGSFNQTYGGLGDFWGLDGITVADLASLEVTVHMQDASGGDMNAFLDYLSVTFYWYIELEQPHSPDVPTTFSYRVFSKNGAYLGDLPNVISPFSFAQDINSAGAVIKTVCGVSPKPTSTTEALLTESSLPIQTNADLDILATDTNIHLLPGNSPDDALFKNGNRLKVWMFNQWWPNGKLMFSGQMNRIDFSVGAEEQITVTTYSDGMDLENYIARGYPFSYTLDQQQTTQNAYYTMQRFPEESGWARIGQTFTTGATGTNVGEIQLLLSGSATVTVNLFDAPNGNFIGSVTKTVVGATFSNPVSFLFPQLLTTSALTQYFFNLDVGNGQSIDVGIAYPTGGYAGGQAYFSEYGGGSGGGSFQPGNPPFNDVDLWFKTGIGTPTTTTTYSSQDPVTGMAAGILADYNLRGGRIFARNLTAAGYNLTYTFNSATINAAIQKIIELSPDGYYAYVDLGTADIDIVPASTDADFIVVVGRDIESLNLSFTIERVINQLLFSGGDTGSGSNLFKQYQDTESATNYDPRLAQKSDNRVTVAATANAIGNAFIAENKDEVQETQVVLLNERVDITQFTPGKTIAFQNTGMFIDDIPLQIVRREFTKDKVTLTIGRLPITQTNEVQRINRELLAEQTVANPSQPS